MVLQVDIPEGSAAPGDPIQEQRKSKKRKEKQLETTLYGL